MGSDVDSLLLSLLSQEHTVPGQPNVTGHSAPNKETGQNTVLLIIDGTRYSLISSTVDLLLQQAGTSLQAARVILAVRKTVGDNYHNDDITNTDTTTFKTQDEEQPTIEFAAHIFAHPQSATTPTPSIIATIIDTDALHASQPTAAQRASAILTQPGPDPQAPAAAAAGRTLGDTYRAYIAAINGGAADMSSRLPEFCHPVVTHNGQELSLQQYQGLMEDAQDAIPDIVFDVADLIVDEDRQQVAARLEFTGTPVKTWAGMKPNGTAVHFSEQVFYWFDEGRVRSVVSLVDMEAYRRHMRA